MDDRLAVRAGTAGIRLRRRLAGRRSRRAGRTARWCWRAWGTPGCRDRARTRSRCCGDRRELPTWSPARCRWRWGSAEIDSLVAGFRAAAAAAVSGSGRRRTRCRSAKLSAAVPFGSDQHCARTGTALIALRLTREVLAAVRAELGPGPGSVPAAELRRGDVVGGHHPRARRRICTANWQTLLDLLVVVRGGLYVGERVPPRLPPAADVQHRTLPGHPPRGRRRGSGRAAGQRRRFADARRALDEGVADFVEMTRAQIADPDLVVKIRRGVVAAAVRAVQSDVPRARSPQSGRHVRRESDAPDTRRSILRGARADRCRRRGAGGRRRSGGSRGRASARRCAVTASPWRTRRSGSAGWSGLAAGAAPHLTALTDWLEDECRRLGVEFRLGRAVSDAETRRRGTRGRDGDPRDRQQAEAADRSPVDGECPVRRRRGAAGRRHAGGRAPRRASTRWVDRSAWRSRNGSRRGGGTCAS